MLSPSESERAIEIARWIGERVSDPASFDRDGGGLAGSSAGSAILFDAFRRTFPHETQWRDLARTHLAHAASVPSNGFGLFEGWTGLLAAADYLADGDRQQYSKLRASVRAALHRHIQTQYAPPFSSPESPQAYDVICGVAGYVLAMDDDEDASAVYALCDYIDWLTEDPSGAHWITPFHLFAADGSVAQTVTVNNLGLAHGMPGLLAALSLNRHARKRRTLIGRLADWIVSKAHDGSPSHGWPCAVDGTRPVAEKVAWCYGTPGVAAAIAHAGDALERSDLRAHAAAALAPVLADTELSRKLPDHALCHGTIGIAFVARSIGVQAKDPALLAQAARLVRETMDAFEPNRPLGYALRESNGTWVDSPGLLGGAAGIALALVTAANPNVGAWLRYFAL